MTVEIGHKGHGTFLGKRGEPKMERKCNPLFSQPKHSIRVAEGGNCEKRVTQNLF
jgi:hypothetical protein